MMQVRQISPLPAHRSTPASAMRFVSLHCTTDHRSATNPRKLQRILGCATNLPMPLAFFPDDLGANFNHSVANPPPWAADTRPFPLRVQPFAGSIFPGTGAALPTDAPDVKFAPARI